MHRYSKADLPGSDTAIFPDLLSAEGIFRLLVNSSTIVTDNILEKG